MMVAEPVYSVELRSRNPLVEQGLDRRCTMRIGGSAWVLTLEDRRDLAEVLALPHRWLGKGANLLIGDSGVDETVVTLGEGFAQLDLDPIHGGRARVRVGAGLDLAKLISATTAAGLAGPEGLAGVPASVGGALRMNAGTATCWMLDWVSRVEVVLPGEDQPTWLERSALPAMYRDCGLPPGTVFLGCELELASDDPERLRGIARTLKQAKAATQPLAARSAGCIFKNPSRETPAGRLIDELGLKGSRAGGAMVSPVHANFIVNEGGARADEVVTLINRIRRSAWQQRGVVLETEVQTWAIDEIIAWHPRDVPESAC
jgi:UDP-N-acetylmuramate dehydrogenase